MTTIKELISLRGRRALITGATGKLGFAIADTLGELGADLLLTDRQETNLKELCAYLKSHWDVDVKYEVCNLENQQERSELLNWMKVGGEGLNILVNNAAFVGTSSLAGWAVPFEEQSVETWRRALEVNITAVFELCQGLTPLLKTADGANIINIASIYGMYAPDWSLYEGTSINNPAAYAVSKGGLIQFTRWLSTTVAPTIRVNSISPGGIYRNQPDIFVQRYRAKTPLNRMATEDDFRGAVAYLASDMAKYVTGQNVNVDGGWGLS